MKYLSLIFFCFVITLPNIFAQEDSSAETTESTMEVETASLEGNNESEVATVTSVLVVAGDSVEEGQLLIEISVGDSAQEITAPLAANISEVYVSEGDEVTLDQELIAFEVSGEESVVTAEDAEETAEDVAAEDAVDMIAVTEAEEATEGVIETVEETAEDTTEEATSDMEATAEDVVEGAEEATEAVETAVEDTAEEAASDMEASAEDVASDIEAAVEDVTEEAEATTEEVVEGAEAAAAEATEGVEAVESTVEEVAEEAASDMEAAAEEVTEEAEATVEEITEEAASDIEAATEEVVEEAEATTEEVVEGTEAITEDVASDMEAAAGEVTEEAEAAVEEVAEGVEETAEGTAEEVGTTVEDVASDMEATAEEGAEATEAAAEEVAEGAEATTEDVASDMETAAEEAISNMEAVADEAVEGTEESTTDTISDEGMADLAPVDEGEELTGTEGEEELSDSASAEDKGSIDEIDTLKTAEATEEAPEEVEGATEEAVEGEDSPVVAEVMTEEVEGATGIAVESLAQIAPADAILTLGFKPQAPENNTLWQDLTALDWGGAVNTLKNLGLFISGGDLFEFLPYEVEIIIEDLFAGIEEGMAASEEFEEALNEVFEFCPALAEVDWQNFSLVGEEMLLTVGMNPYSPEPAITLMMLMGNDQAATAQEIQNAFFACAKEELGEDMLELEEEGITLYVLDDGGDFPVIAGNVGNAHFLSSNVDTARAIVRLAKGADEPNLASTSLQQKRNEVLAEKGLSFSIDLAATAEVLSAFKGAIVEDEVTEYLFDRGIAALNTIGGYASNIGIAPEGLLAESIVAANPEGGDSDLAELLLCSDCTVSVPEFAPSDAVSISASYFALEEFMAYLQTWLDGLAPYIGEMNMQELAMSIGVDLDLLLGWLGKEIQVVTLEPLSQNLSTLVYQPASAFILPVESVEAAEEGRAAWASFWPMIQMGLELMDDEEFPSAIFDYVASDTYEFEGVTIERYRFSFNVDIAVAYIDNNLIFASPPSAMHKLITTANGEIENILSNTEFNTVYESLPEPVIGFSFGDNALHTRAYADLLGLFSQPIAFFIKIMLDQALEVTANYGYDVEFPEEVLTNSYFEEDLSSIEPTPFDVGTSEPVSGNLALAEESTDTADMSVAYYELTGLNVGDTVAATLSSQDFDTYLTLIATTEEGGEVILENDDFDGSYSESQVAFTAQEGVSGYIIEVRSYAGEGSGAYSLTVEASEAPSADLEFFAAYPAEFTGEASNSIAVGETAEGELQASEAAVLADYFELTGLNAGDEVTINLTSIDFDTYLYIIDATNESYVAENDDFEGSYETSQVSFTAQEGVTYLVKATSFDGSGEGAYDLTINSSATEMEAAGEEETGLYAEEDIEELSPEDMLELVPSFAEVLNLTGIVPQALLVLADHLGYSEGHTAIEGDTIYSRSLIRITW